MYAVTQANEGIEGFLPGLEHHELEYLYRLNAEQCHVSPWGYGEVDKYSVSHHRALWLPNEGMSVTDFPGWEDGSIASTINGMLPQTRRFFAEVSHNGINLNLLMDAKRISSKISPDVLAGGGFSDVSLPRIRDVWDAEEKASPSSTSPFTKIPSKDTSTAWTTHTQNALSSGGQILGKTARDQVSRIEDAMRIVNYYVAQPSSAMNKKNLEKAYQQLLHEFNSALPAIRTPKWGLDKTIKLSLENHDVFAISKLGRSAKYLAPGLMIVDLGTSFHTVRSSYLTGGNWQRELAGEMGGYAGGTAGAAVGAVVLLSLTPAGWALAAIVIGGAVGGAWGTETGNQIAKRVWDAYENL